MLGLWVHDKEEGESDNDGDEKRTSGLASVLQGKKMMPARRLDVPRHRRGSRWSAEAPTAETSSCTSRSWRSGGKAACARRGTTSWGRHRRKRGREGTLGWRTGLYKGAGAMVPLCPWRACKERERGRLKRWVKATASSTDVWVPRSHVGQVRERVGGFVSEKEIWRG